MYEPLSAPGSTLVHGESPTALVVLAAGLAAKLSGTFAWAHAPSANDRIDPAILNRVERCAGAPSVHRFRSDDFEVPALTPDGEAGVVEPASIPAPLHHQLDEFLRLPRIFQTLASRTVDPTGGASIVFSGLESLPRAYLEHGFCRKKFHRDLRDLGFFLFVTYRGGPPGALRDACDSELELVGGTDVPWTTVRVVARGRPSAALRAPISLAELWGREGLDPSLLARSP